jgi:hypothetical protein
MWAAGGLRLQVDQAVLLSEQSEVDGVTLTYWPRQTAG